VKVLVYETNLMWSSRLMNSLTKLGHEPVLVGNPTPEAADAAIVNLGEESFAPIKLVPELKALGTVVIGHAGHKEKDLHALGREAGCDILATNSELTYKLESILAKAGGRGQGSEN
jgi:hypothetical protein